jgi:hypothetical protein
MTAIVEGDSGLDVAAVEARAREAAARYVLALTMYALNAKRVGHAGYVPPMPLRERLMYSPSLIPIFAYARAFA